MTKSNLNIAVTGATGHLGRVLVPMLFKRGHRVRCLVRGEVPEDLKGLASWTRGSLDASEEIKDFLKGADILIHAASLISVGEKNRKSVYRVNVKATETLVQACTEFKTKLIYISSSTAAEDPRIGDQLNEKSPLRENSGFYYAWTKAEAEKIIRSAQADRGLEGFIFRPTALVGPPDHRPSRFGKVIWKMHLGKMKLVPSGGYNLLDIRDFSTAVVNSLEKGRSGEVYLAGGNYISLKELARLANPGASTYKVSIDLLQFLLPLLEPLKPFIPSLQEMNRESLSTLKNAPRSVDSSRAQNLLGLKSRPAKETVEDLISWMKIREE